MGSGIESKGLVSGYIAPVADPTDFGVVMLDDALGLETILG